MQDPIEKPVTTWRPMSEYPRDHLAAEETHWGPTVLVRVPLSDSWSHGPTYFEAHLEADLWMVRDASDPRCWSDLYELPDVWMPIERVD